MAKLTEKSKEFPISPSWQLVFKDLGLSLSDVLRRAQLPEDLFLQKKTSLTTEEYFRLWRSLEVEIDDPLFPLRLSRAVTTEVFSPPLFAAMCSQHMLAASKRISTYKRLIAPVLLHVREETETLELTFEWLDALVEPPVSFAVTELLFLLQLARISTREEILPLRMVMVQPPDPADAYTDFLGRPIEQGDAYSITFSMEDAIRPFLTANESLWDLFEPDFRKRLSELDASTTTTERVRVILLEALPSGTCSIDDVARRLAIGKRTLQRRLSEEDTSFQSILDRTREELARHYLTQTTITSAEISFLLGFEEPNSFYRAFLHWTGTTPEQLRRTQMH